MTDTYSTKTLTAANGVAFTARIVLDCQRYGLDDCLVHSGEPLVEFYDTRYPETDYGQFVSSYFVASIMMWDSYMDEGDARGRGLNLDGGVPIWTIDGATMDLFREWLAATVPPDTKARAEAEAAEVWGKFTSR